MSVTRADATVYLSNEFAALWTEAGITPTDTAAGVKGPLDSAFRALGVAQSDLPTATVADSEAERLEASLDYFGLRRLARALANAVNVSKAAAGASVSKSRSDLARSVQALLKDAETRLQSYGLLPGGAAMFNINLDLLEPVDAD